MAAHGTHRDGRMQGTVDGSTQGHGTHMHQGWLHTRAHGDGSAERSLDTMDGSTQEAHGTQGTQDTQHP